MVSGGLMPRREPGHQGRVPGQTVDGRGQLPGVPFVDKQAVAAVLDHVGYAPDTGGHDGQSGRLRLHDRLGPVVLPARGKDGDVHVGQDADRSAWVNAPWNASREAWAGEKVRIMAFTVSTSSGAAPP